MKVLLRGSADSPGEEAPRRFLAILSPAERTPFTKGSGRLELAESIADSKNPLTSRRDGESHLAAPFRAGHRANS
jgi:hypothetical protein